MATATVISPVNVSARKELDVRAGDTVKVWQKIQEKGKTRFQVFEGLVLSVKHGAEAGSTFTVRRVASGVGVEKIFPLYSPMIDKIEIVRRSKVRRAKLYYIRDKVAREIKRQMRGAAIMGVSIESDIAEKDRMEKEAEAEAAEVARVEKEAEEEAKRVEAEATAPVAEAAMAGEEAEVTATETPEAEEPTEDTTTEEKKEE